MRKSILAVLVLISLLPAFLLTSKVRANLSAPAPYLSSASDLVSAVNSLRGSHGLAPYQTNSILMSIAQAQAEYLVSLGTITHTGPGGSLPFQRALAAGYLVAGDLSQGGFFSENISAGIGQTAEDAVQVWMGDAPHKNTMLSRTLQDVGAGVGTNGNTFYYVLDCGLSTGGTPVAYTPHPSLSRNTPTIVPNTPNADGSIIHVVHTGDTLGSLSMAYNIPLADILKQNNLTLKSVIYIGQKIIIHAAYTPTSTLPTGTPTRLPTITNWSTSTSTASESPLPPTLTPRPGLSTSSAGGAVFAIVIAALIIAGLISLMGIRKK